MDAAGDPIRRYRIIRFVEWHCVELMLLICSASLALRLFAFSDEARLCAGGHGHVVAIIDERIFWGTAAAVASTLKIVGLLDPAHANWRFVSTASRFVGLLISSVMWTIFGISYFLDCPYEIAGMPMVMMGLSAGALRWGLHLRPGD